MLAAVESPALKVQAKYDYNDAQVSVLKGHWKAVIGLLHKNNHNDSQLYSIGEDCICRAWSLKDEKTTHCIYLNKRDELSSAMQVSDDGNLVYLASGHAVYEFDLRHDKGSMCQSNHVRKFDLVDHIHSNTPIEQAKQDSEEENEINSMCFANDDKNKLIIGNDSGHIWSIDLAGDGDASIQNLSQTGSAAKHTNICSSVKMSTNMDGIVWSGSFDCSIAASKLVQAPPVATSVPLVEPELSSAQQQLPQYLSFLNDNQQVASAPQSFNPPFVHDICPITSGTIKTSESVAVALGNGVLSLVEYYDDQHAKKQAKKKKQKKQIDKLLHLRHSAKLHDYAITQVKQHHTQDKVLLWTASLDKSIALYDTESKLLRYKSTVQYPIEAVAPIVSLTTSTKLAFSQEAAIVLLKNKL